MEAKDWLGKRALVMLGKNTGIEEVIFLEISPANIYIKFKYNDNDGCTGWINVDDVHIVEFLPDVDGD